MTGLRSVMEVTKDALKAQQFGIQTISHNISNVDTEGYSRQTVVFQPKDSESYAGLLLGRGVETQQIRRITDQFIENQLIEKRSNLSSFSEMENNMQVLEGLFNENSESSISKQMSNFWNLWHDISNDPSSGPERSALYEQSVLLSEQFNTLDANMDQLEMDLNNAMRAGIERINLITEEIAELNGKIVGMEAGVQSANDLRDTRYRLVSELSEYVDVKTFEQNDGSLTVVSVRGIILVGSNSSYDLSLNATAVEWQSSGGNKIDITDYLTNGKLGAWLEMRDEVIEKYKLDLDSVTKEFVWAVNEQHSEGVGLKGFSSVTSTYAVDGNGLVLDTAAGLDYEDKIIDGAFNLYVYNNGAYDTTTTIAVDADVTTLDSLKTAIDGVTDITATITSGRLQITAGTGYTFAFSDDTSNALAALGINTFFTGATAGAIGVNDKIGSDKDYIAAAKVNNNVGPAVASSTNTGTGTIVTSGRYTGTTDATYTIEITTTGDEDGAGAAIFRWSDDGGATWTAGVTASAAPQLLNNGVSVTFMPGTYNQPIPDTFTIDVTANSTTYGAFASGDNSNARDIADLQYTSTAITQTTVDRIDGNTTQSVTSTFEEYYHGMVASIGTKSASISMSSEFNEVMVNKLSEIRDSVSAVSLDEEMINMIAFQYGYAAAAKLIGVADEMLQTLLNVK